MQITSTSSMPSSPNKHINQQLTAQQHSPNLQIHRTCLPTYLLPHKKKDHIALTPCRFVTVIASLCIVVVIASLCIEKTTRTTTHTKHTHSCTAHKGGSTQATQTMKPPQRWSDQPTDKARETRQQEPDTSALASQGCWPPMSRSRFCPVAPLPAWVSCAQKGRERDGQSHPRHGHADRRCAAHKHNTRRA